MVPTTARIEKLDRDAAVRLAVKLTSGVGRRLNISDILGAAIKVAGLHLDEMQAELRKRL